MLLFPIILGLSAWGWWALRPGSRPPPLREPADSLATLEPKQAYLRGQELARKGRFTEALPYLRHAVARRGDVWLTHSDYASALVNSAGESRLRRGLAGPTTRSSWERIARIREAFEQMDQAERRALEGQDRALAKQVRAHSLRTWGLLWDSLLEYRLARHDDPTGKDLAAAALSLESWMRNPPAATP